MHVTIRRGLDLALDGVPRPLVEPGRDVRSVGLLGRDAAGARVRLQVGVGDRVRLGQSLFVDRRRPEIRFTSPGTGTVSAVNLGPRRRLESVVVALDGSDEAESFPSWPEGLPADSTREQLVELLLRSGWWPALRTRPFDRIPSPEGEPSALLVTAIDTRPLAAPASLAIAERPEDFASGLSALTFLTAGRVFVCHPPEAAPPVPRHDRLVRVAFEGPHPAGLPGTHAHHLAPVHVSRAVWHVGSQDVIALGRLLTTGRPDIERLVSLGGALVERPRVLRTRLGASLTELVDGELADGQIESRESLDLIAGSPLDGRVVDHATALLGRREVQVAALPPAPVPRAPQRSDGLVPTTRFEAVLPFDLPIVALLRALQAGDDETAEELGALELVEEDLALSSHVCPARLDHGAALRAVLDRLERVAHAG